LIIGDEGLGRSSIAIDTVINQKDKNVYCVYVLIGQKRSTIVSTIDTLRKQGALAYTVCVVAEANALAGLQYIAPFAGCALAEYWMELGRDTLIVYDDLSTHARTYRELSLLLRRPPGREAYPGDIFFVHSRLLERSTSLNAEHGGGSMTALPIVETQQGEIAAYIPTNLISITDGQLYLDKDLFVSGFRPAIDITKSVSRIGGKAQHASIRDQAGQMKLDYLQFLELEAFTRFGQRLEASMEARIKRGRLLRELLKQERLMPLSHVFQLAWLIAFNAGLLNDIDIKQLADALKRIEHGVETTTLTMDSPYEQWQHAISQWLSSS
jgi:F-type H+-transporting ATPase subunit alpha